MTATTEVDEPAATLALGELCQMYWQPIYVYVRGRGWNETDAQDLTQEFFAKLLAKGSLHGADAERGKLRAYLLGSVCKGVTIWNCERGVRAASPPLSNDVHIDFLDIHCDRITFAEPKEYLVHD